MPGRQGHADKSHYLKSEVTKRWRAVGHIRYTGLEKEIVA